MSSASPEIIHVLTTARAWPFEEARKLVERFAKKPPEKGYALFETGYGPSGLPHIGTFGEVVRTSMVRHAFQAMSDIPTRLFCFSDDMDGLRKVPDNIPNKELVTGHLGKSLTTIPDPFGTHESFGHHNNARLRGFLDSFGFQYEFQSATDWYKSGRFDETLLKVLRHYDEIMALMLPTLGEERQGTYSPFLPVSPATGKVLQVPLIARDVDAGTIAYKDEDGTVREVPVTGGHCKLQWKPDWAMRWVALGVDYEMSGKDLIPSVQLGQKIARVLGGNPPEGFTYELFLDEDGGKISKSKGNGLAVEEWLHYAPPESLSLFMYQQPRRAKRLHIEAIPRAVDEYITFAQKYPNETPEAQIENPVWHIHNGNPPLLDCPLTFGMLLNLAGVANADDPKVLWGFISRYLPGATPESLPFLGRLAEHAVNYYQDQIKPTKQFRAANDTERAALTELSAMLADVPADSTAEALQTEVYEIGKRHPFPELKDWFKGIYAVLFGRSEGPRMGSFIQLYGIAETRQLIDDALAGKFIHVDKEPI